MVIQRSNENGVLNWGFEMGFVKCGVFGGTEMEYVKCGRQLRGIQDFCRHTYIHARLCTHVKYICELMHLSSARYAHMIKIWMN